MEYDKLKFAIDSLCEIQKRRIKMYYFEDMTLEKIATIENCTKVAIKYSIDNAIENLKKFLKNNNKF
ncbi:MAG: sigma factor-like helix-turn-helix DNA-binding protein [Clostridia bacterium]|nr:sigma factor-like helix-turn-helix DNA-binding protein [Clostridia bacterium]